MLGYREWDSLYQEGRLNPIQAAFFETKPAEMLYDLSNDPYETNNLVDDPAYKEQLGDLRQELNQWIKGMPDLSFYPEHVLIEQAFHNPVAFGQANQQAISRYVDIADLQLLDFGSVKSKIEQALVSSDPWERYWALIVCSNFGNEARELLPEIQKATDDPEPINRARAAEYLGLTRLGDPVPGMLEALYVTAKPAEALLILNSIVLLESYNYGYEFDIDPGSLQAAVVDSDEVQRRLQFLVEAAEPGYNWIGEPSNWGKPSNNRTIEQGNGEPSNN